VAQHTILGWIRRGELKAIDVSREPGGRPRWRISEDAIADFERQRTYEASEPRRRRRRKPAAMAEEFF